MQIIIEGKPIPKKRPRFAKRGKFVTTYSAQKKEEEATKDILKREYGDYYPIKGAVYCKLLFYMPIPKSTSKKNRAEILEGRIKHTKKPDLDNLVKYINDCMNGIVFVDDSQIISSSEDKIYSDNPRTEIYVEEAIK